MRIGHAIDSTPVVSETNRKWAFGFRGVRIPILAVSRLQLPRFFTDRHRNPKSANINQLRHRTRWSANPEIEFGFREVQIPISVSILSAVERSPTQFFTDFHKKIACGWEMWSARRFLFLRQTGSKYPINQSINQ